MNCPNCHSLMKCISAINPIPGQPGRDRMDLRCTFDAGHNKRGCDTRCHMGVITEDPKEWKCHEYGFGFFHKNKYYLLSSYDTVVDPIHQSRFPSPHTYLIKYGSIMFTLPYFIPISTGDNMHEEAWKLFHRLKDLAIYS